MKVVTPKEGVANSVFLGGALRVRAQVREMRQKDGGRYSKAWHSLVTPDWCPHHSLPYATCMMLNKLLNAFGSPFCLLYKAVVRIRESEVNMKFIIMAIAVVKCSSFSPLPLTFVYHWWEPSSILLSWVFGIEIYTEIFTNSFVFFFNSG